MPEASEISALQRIAGAPAVQSRWNTEVVRSAWSAVQRRRRDAERAARSSAGDFGDLRAEPVRESEDPLTWGWIEQLWTDHLIVRCGDNSDQAARIPYTVDAPGTAADQVHFGQPERVRMAYVAASRSSIDAVMAAADRADSYAALAGFPFKDGKDSKSSKDSKGSGNPFASKDSKTKPGAAPAAAPTSIKSLKDLSAAIASFSKAKPADQARLKTSLLSAARRLGASDAVIVRIKALSVSSSKIAASNSEDVLELTRRVRSMQGARRYRKPIGSPLGDGTTGRVAEATGKDSNPRADALRKDIKNLAARDKTYRGGKVFGDIGNKGKLKQALSSIENLPDGKRGAAAAEIVLAAQALGLTALVPMKVKRLYRSYLAQKPKQSGDKKE